MSTNILIDKILEKKNPTVAGLDPLCDYLPQSMITGDSPAEKADAIFRFNKDIIDGTTSAVHTDANLMPFQAIGVNV